MKKQEKIPGIFQSLLVVSHQNPHPVGQKGCYINNADGEVNGVERVSAKTIYILKTSVLKGLYYTLWPG